ncbi:hypothetical protein EJB05_51349, partial [Eragrostis curvula]
MAAGPRSAASIESGWPEQAAAASARGPGPPSGCGERAVSLCGHGDSRPAAPVLIARSADIAYSCPMLLGGQLAGQLAGILLEDLDTEDICRMRL